MVGRYLLFFLFFILLDACDAPQQKTAPVNEAKTNDSIARILKELRAEEKASQLDALFKQWVKTKKFNGNVLIAQRGQILYKNSFGFSDYKKKDSLRINSSFQIASVSKQFTAVAVMILKERGKLDYSDTLQKFFPELPYKNITVRMLLTHRSGLPNYMYFCEGYCAGRSTPLSNMEVVQLMSDCKPDLYQRPDRKFNYCNTNYCLLAAIVEKVSGVTFEQFMKTTIFQPLGMKDTWICNSADSVCINKTNGYEGNWRKIDPDYLDGVTGDKGVYSTVEDLFRWDRALYTEKLVKQTTLEEAYTPASKERKGNKNYGFGWRTIQEEDGTKIVFHNGWWHGYSSAFVRRLNDQTAIIILCNKLNMGIYHIQDVLDLLTDHRKKVSISDGEEQAL